eukprot:scaffold4502_cov119-Isochrysis_galbana.AAC.2
MRGSGGLPASSAIARMLTAAATLRAEKPLSEVTTTQSTRRTHGQATMRERAPASCWPDKNSRRGSPLSSTVAWYWSIPTARSSSKTALSDATTKGWRRPRALRRDAHGEPVGQAAAAEADAQALQARHARLAREARVVGHKQNALAHRQQCVDGLDGPIGSEPRHAPQHPVASNQSAAGASAAPPLVAESATAPWVAAGAAPANTGAALAAGSRIGCVRLAKACARSMKAWYERWSSVETPDTRRGDDAMPAAARCGSIGGGGELCGDKCGWGDRGDCASCTCADGDGTARDATSVASQERSEWVSGESSGASTSSRNAPTAQLRNSSSVDSGSETCRDRRSSKLFCGEGCWLVQGPTLSKVSHSLPTRTQDKAVTGMLSSRESTAASLVGGASDARLKLPSARATHSSSSSGPPPTPRTADSSRGSRTGAASGVPGEGAGTSAMAALSTIIAYLHIAARMCAWCGWQSQAALAMRRTATARARASARGTRAALTPVSCCRSPADAHRKSRSHMATPSAPMDVMNLPRALPPSSRSSYRAQDPPPAEQSPSLPAKVTSAAPVARSTRTTSTSFITMDISLFSRRRSPSAPPTPKPT